MLDTLANVKDALSISTSEYDGFLTRQIQLISDVIEAYCRRKFSVATYIQTFYGCDFYNRSFELFYYPVISLDSAHIDDVLMADADFQNIVVHKPSGKLLNKYGTWVLGDKVAFQFTAGYVNIPSPILSVLYDLVQERYNKKTSGVDLNFGSDVQRVSIPGAISIDFDYSLSNNERSAAYGTILGSSVNILDDWRSERAVVGSGSLEFIEEVEAP